MKKIFLKLLCTILVLHLFGFNVSAASYPSIYPKDFDLFVVKGSVAKLPFSIHQEYKNEKYHINVYEGDKVDPNKLVATASDSSYFVKGWGDLIIEWDTSDVECGIYTVEHYMSFYSLHEWHEVPNRYSMMKITVFEPGQVMTSVLNTDIRAYIDGCPIPSYNIDGNTAIVVEDLEKYGFSVVYNNTDRSLTIDDLKEPITSTYTHTKNEKTIGSKVMDVYYTDIKTYIKYISKFVTDHKSELKVDSYNVNGNTLIKIDDLDELGNIIWDPNKRTISFTRK